MKALIFSFLFSLVILAPSYAQQIVPDRVQVKFRAKYPSYTQSVSWAPAYGNYQASFINEGIPTQIVFSEKGAWLQTRTTLKQDQLPTLAQQYIKDNHVESRYIEGFRYESPEGARYQMKLKSTVGQYRLDFDQDGGFINEEPAG